MKRIIFVLSAFAFLTATGKAWAADAWSFEVYTGTALHMNTNLEISRDGHEDKSLTAEYETKPFEDAIYYGLRVGRWVQDKSWEVELIHHKLYLENPPEGVKHFEITHGYNLLTVNRGWNRGGYILRAGLGWVLAHPEPEFEDHGDGDITHPDHEHDILEFQFAGPTAQVSVAKRFYMTGRSFANVEAKLTASYAKVRFEGGDATAPNVALHFTIGLGYDYKRPES